MDMGKKHPLHRCMHLIYVALNPRCLLHYRISVLLSSNLLQADETSLQEELSLINKQLRPLIVDNESLALLMLLINMCTWTLVGVGVQTGWDTNDIVFMSVLVSMTAGLVCSAVAYAWALADRSDVSEFHKVLLRLKQEVLPAFNARHHQSQPPLNWDWKVSLLSS
jgi:hypothetical protein